MAINSELHLGRGTAVGAVPPATATEPVAAIRVAGSYDAFFADQYPALVSLLGALTGQRAVAEELAQEALLRAHLRWSTVGRYDCPGAWVRRVAINLATNSWARRRTERRLVRRLGAERPTSSLGLGLGQPDEQFWATVRTLPERQAAAVTLHYLEDRPVAEVAEIMGCAVGTAKAHLHKGRAALARLLDPQEPFDGHR